MLAYKITKARLNNEEIIHKPQLKPLSEIALKIVARNFLLYKTLPNLPEEYKKKVYDIMAVDYKIEDIFPVIDYEPFWERACRKHFKSDDCAANGNSWKQCYAENYIKKLISSYNSVGKDPEETDKLLKVFRMVNYHIFNLEIPTFSCNFDISYIPQCFVNLTSLSLKYSPVLRDSKGVDLFSKKLEPIKEEYSQFGMRIPDLKKFCILISELPYFISLSLQGNLVDDEMIKWLVPGLITNQTLRNLDLSSNRITEKGMVKIASYLVRTRSLLSLDLSNNLIGGEASFAIGLVLKENTRLKVLKLAMNRLTDENGGRIFKMLAKNKYLEELDLSTNKLGNETVTNLNLGLKYNNTIRIINLCHTDVLINEDTKKIADAHPTLINLNVHHTKTPEADAKQLENLLVKKSVKLHLVNKVN